MQMSPHLCAYTYSFIYQQASSSIRNSYSTFSNTWLLVCRLLRSTKVMFFFHRHAHHKDKLGRRLGACHVLVLVGSLILSLCCHDRIDIVNARTQVAKSSVLESASRKSSACCWPMLLSWSTPWKIYSCYHLPGFVCERENLWRSLDLKGAISMTADLVPRLCKVEAEFGTIRHPPYFV